GPTDKTPAAADKPAEKVASADKIEKPADKPAEKPADKKPSDKKKKVAQREKMKDNDMIKSDNFTWRVIKLLGSGGFGDVYKVVKENDADKQEYAMKTEMCEGDKRMLRLKIEVRVLGLCTQVENPEKKNTFSN
ncbi:hypothetical protein OSTOST_22232, partial [Ostertagia ostertagi]